MTGSASQVGAIESATADALEDSITQLPVTAERVFQALSTRNST